MKRYTALLGSAAMSLALGATAYGSAFAQAPAEAPPPETSGPVGDETVVVTANKVQQRINDVAMSVQAASGKELTKLGVTDTAQLTKIVPGFNYTLSFYGTPVYTLRGVGFQDTSLAAAPTVSVYSDEVPLPYSIMTSGAGLDVSRVEILKGPQGVAFGSNATGGSVNYIANKPSDDFAAGATLSYGRFNTVDLQGYVGGPINDTLNYRLALRTLQSGPWQKSYTHPDEWGRSDLWTGRAAVEWTPDENFTALLTVSGFVDGGDTQMPALAGIAVLSPVSFLDPRIGVFPFNQFGRTGGSHYPFAPHNNRAADWSPCVNDSPFDPPFNTLPLGSLEPTASEDCHAATKDNTYYNISLRMDYDLTDDITLTSLSSYQNFQRDSYLEGDGTIYQDYENNQQGYIETWYQELRIQGTFGGTGNWVVGGNYEHDGTYDRFLQTYGGSTASPTALPGAIFCGGQAACTAAGLDVTGVPDYYLIYLGPTAPTNKQETEAYAFFASGEYEINEQFAIEAGVRYTHTFKSSYGCGNDGGDGSWSKVSQGIQNLLQFLNGTITLQDYLQPGAPGGLGIDVGPYACATTGPGPLFHPDTFYDELTQDNVSWKIGVNWKPVEGTLIYANVKQGYKQGAYPTVATSAFTQLVPAVQEGLLAYEVGVKTSLADDTLQINAAAFYYDYEDKQLLGAVIDPVFGPLPALVNVPKSHVVGFEISAVWQPIDGLRIAPAVSYSHSKVDGCSGETPGGLTIPGCHDGHYYNFDPFSQNVDLTGQQFPSAPEWQAQLDIEYEWELGNDMTAFVGGNVNFQDSTPGFFFSDEPYHTEPDADGTYSGNNAPPDILKIDSYTLLDLRAGVQTDNWRLQIWGRNVTNEYYFVTNAHVNDVIVRYNGMPATWGFTLSYTY